MSCWRSFCRGGVGARTRQVTESGGVGVVLRFGLFYGPGSPDTKRFLARARRGRLMLPGPAEHYSSMIFVADAAAAVVAALDVPGGLTTSSRTSHSGASGMQLRLGA